MKLSLCLAVLVSAVFAGVTPRAQAQPIPVICDTVQEVRLFLLGVRKGRNLAKQAIHSIGTPPDICVDADSVELLQATVVDIASHIAVPPDASQAVQCHVQGQVVGLVAEVTDLQDTCNGTCITDGQFIGEISAQLYCALSIALGGLVPVELFERLATNACGQQFEDACDDTFEDTAAGDPECHPFTVDPFDEVFFEAQNNQCAFNPAPHP